MRVKVAYTIESLWAVMGLSIFVVILCLLVVYLLYLYMYYSFDGDLEKRNTELADKLTDHKIQALVNGSSINNIPNLNIVTTNPGVLKSASCAEGPAYIGLAGTDRDCIRTCANASASVINVHAGETYIYKHMRLQEGAHCVIGPRPNCNMRTTRALMTINSVVCHSKFPEIVGGPVGNTVVACNNNDINDPKNTLWDMQLNRRYNPQIDHMMDMNAIMPDGKYRYVCKFNGTDIHRNKYVAHPFNRFHPIRNYCSSQIVAAAYTVSTVIDRNAGTYKCNCGHIATTNVANIDPDDASSFCSNLQKRVRTDVKKRQIMTVPYRCFTLFSPISDVGKYLPCPNDQFVREGSQFTSVDVPFSLEQHEPIEHPQYSKLKSTVAIGEGLIWRN